VSWGRGAWRGGAAAPPALLTHFSFTARAGGTAAPQKRGVHSGGWTGMASAAPTCAVPAALLLVGLVAWPLPGEQSVATEPDVSSMSAEDDFAYWQLLRQRDGAVVSKDALLHVANAVPAKPKLSQSSEREAGTKKASVRGTKRSRSKTAAHKSGVAPQQATRRLRIQQPETGATPAPSPTHHGPQLISTPSVQDESMSEGACDVSEPDNAWAGADASASQAFTAPSELLRGGSHRKPRQSGPMLVRPPSAESPAPAAPGPSHRLSLEANTPPRIQLSPRALHIRRRAHGPWVVTGSDADGERDGAWSAQADAPPSAAAASVPASSLAERVTLTLAPRKMAVRRRPHDRRHEGYTYSE
jgi:hypothetical protein